MVSIAATLPPPVCQGNERVPGRETTQVLFLCQQALPGAKARHLLDSLGLTQLHVALCSLDQVDVATIADFDLILYETDDAQAMEVQATLTWLRMSSRAPLVVLARATSAEYALLALIAGADAVITPAIRLEIVVAQCHALLRRWRLSRQNLPTVDAALAPQ